MEDDGDVFDVRQDGLSREVAVDGGVDVVVVEADVLRDAAGDEVVGVVVEITRALGSEIVAPGKVIVDVEWVDVSVVGEAISWGSGGLGVCLFNGGCWFNQRIAAAIRRIGTACFDWS